MDEHDADGEAYAAYDEVDSRFRFIARELRSGRERKKLAAPRRDGRAEKADPEGHVLDPNRRAGDAARVKRADDRFEQREKRHREQCKNGEAVLEAVQGALHGSAGAELVPKLLHAIEDRGCYEVFAHPWIGLLDDLTPLGKNFVRDFDNLEPTFGHGVEGALLLFAVRTAKPFADLSRDE